jgi:hypothetical protein
VIARACYVMCDECGNAGPTVVFGAKEARSVAKVESGFARIDGRDLCAACRPDAPDHSPHSPYEPRRSPAGSDGTEGGRS